MDGSVLHHPLFDVLRFPLIVLVTYAHSYSAVSDSFSVLGGSFTFYDLLRVLVSQVLAKVPVPVFFFISGYLFFANVAEWNARVYFRKIGHRVRSLLVPYLVWNAAAALLLSLRTHSWSSLDLNVFWTFYSSVGLQTDWFGSVHQMTAPCNVPLWFLRDLMVVSLLAPVLHAVLRRFGTIALTLLGLLYLSGICPFMPGFSAYAVFFFTFGAYFPVSHRDFAGLASRVERPAAAAFFVLAAAMVLTYNSPVFSSLMLVFRLVSLPVVFNLGRRFLDRGRILPPLFVRSAYFVYLAHFVLFFQFIDTAFLSVFGLGQPSLCVHYLLSPLVKALLLVGFYKLYLAFLSFFRTFARE